MTSLTQRIQEATPRNNELLATLSETDHATPALEQQKLYVRDLDNQLLKTQQRISQLGQQRKKELKEHEKYRDSVMRRFAYKVGRKSDKFEERAQKEEREYFDVLQDEHKTKQHEKDLGQMRDEALSMQRDLEGQAAKHAQAQRELENLYNSIFEGPTPDFPEEDNAEYKATRAQKVYRDGKMKADNESLVLNNLTEAGKRIQSALNHTEEALSHSRMDMFGGDTMSDMLERNALSNAERQVMDAQWLVSQAQRMSPMVVGLPPVKIAQGNLMSDVFFDNIFTDMAFHEKIHQSRQELLMCADALQKQISAARGRHQELEWHVKDKAMELDAARVELHKARQRIFERIGEAEPLPVYEP